ncbi:MAG: sensor histidine kinase, partial [Candidatus Heimdallarchaeota archaeon]
IDLLIPVTIFVLRIYWKQKTITRLFMFIVFLVGALTALSTIIALYYEWGVAANYAMNFIFITLIMTAGIAAPIEQRITKSEEEYKVLSEHLEEKISERTQQLEEVNTELKAFSYTVSHDLRAPLRSIMGFSNLLGDEYSQVIDDKGKDYLERIIKSSYRMNEMIDDLLTLAQISRANIKLEDINLSELAHDIMDELVQVYPEQKIDYQIQENITANCDNKLIHIVLENLLGNALKFSIVNANPKIIFGMDKQDNRVVYYIKDNGAGFDMSYYDKLFGLFQRLHSSTDFEGTGIGLTTVKRIIDRHNGKIWAEGEVDKGATFYFTLS